MTKSRLILIGTFVAASFSLADCGQPTPGPSQGSGDGGSSGSGSGGSSGSGTGGTTGTPLAKPGDRATASGQYLNLGDMRLINNRWGSDARSCAGTNQSVFINTDSTFGWTSTRPTCGGARGNPDFPEVEFGVAPFGMTSSLRTTPAFSSTTLLPIQLKNLTSASVTFDTFTSSFTSGYYDNNFEFWISKMDPTTNATGGVYAEIIMFTGWETGRNNTSQGGWTCDQTGSVSSAGMTYNLCHQSDTWSNGQWRFFNFNVNSTATNGLGTVNGKADIKAILDYITGRYTGFTQDMWLTRIEVGTEVDDNTSGMATIRNLTFEINGISKSAQLGK